MKLVIHPEKLNTTLVDKLVSLCPFKAIDKSGDGLSINAGCKLCKLCVKNSGGAITLEEDRISVDKTLWNDVCVFADFINNRLHPVSLELIGKGVELVKVTKQKVIAVVIGYHTKNAVAELIKYGAQKVYVYDYDFLEHADYQLYTDVLTDFINKIKPSAILVGATNYGRALAPRIAARFKTGMTADCTALEMDANTDLIQIRPAFGGNIMAKIKTSMNRPQICTARYKVFDKISPSDKNVGEIIPMTFTNANKTTATSIIKLITKAKEQDISDADIVVVAGRGFKKKEDLILAQNLADALGAQLGCSRPLVENGWMDSKKQVGLSGRTIKPKLIITLGVSGAIQFTAGMVNSDNIISVNIDKNAPIFDVAHHGFVGNLYEIVPELIKQIKEHR